MILRRFRNGATPFFLIWGLLAPMACLAPAGVVQSIDGSSTSGTVRIVDGNLLVGPSLDTATRIAADNILHAAFIDDPDRQLQCGVMLINGSVIAGDIIVSADQKTLRLEQAERLIEIPIADIARVVFRSVRPEMWSKIPAGHTGAVLDNGDFSEGDFLAISATKLKISSLLFGITELETGNKAMALVLHEIKPATVNWIIRLRDGSVVLADKIKLTSNTITAQDIDGRTSPIRVGQIADIRAGWKQMDCLADHKPDAVDSLDDYPWAADMVVTNGVAMRLRGVSITRGICETAGTSLTFSLPQPRRALVARAGTPLDLPPYVKVQFVIDADGREVYRSPAITSAETAVFVNVPMRGVKQITLKVESDLRGDLGAVGLWGDIAFIKPIEEPATKP